MPGTQSIAGINSGLDTNAIVDAMIEFGRANAYVLEAQQAEKGNIITALKALEAKILGLKAQISQLNRSSTFEKTSVTVSDSAYLTASGFGKVGTGQYDLQILSLARNHQMASQGFDDQTSDDMGTGTIDIQVGNGSVRTITIDNTNNSLMGIKNAINEADIGVTATIINDGSDTNANRLVLSGDLTGRENSIEITSNLTGGLNLNYTDSIFDVPETITSATGSSSTISLGASADFTGAEHKTYTFTVQGTGEQTIGSGTITVDWTDGTNSGSIDVDAAGQVQLTGAGADGLWVDFGAGILTAGDEFSVSTFTPTLQEASDAKVSLGSAGGSGSPITVTSTTNTISDLIAGVTLNLKKVTDPGDSVGIEAKLDTTSVKSQIKSFITAYNDVIGFIDQQNEYDADTGSTGVLFTDSSVWTMQRSLRAAVGRGVAGLGGEFNQLFSIGIRTNASGELAIVDASRLDAALENNIDEVVRLFTAGGDSTNSLIEFVAADAQTQTGYSYLVDITNAAEKGTYVGTSLADPATTGITITSTDDELRLKVDGVISGTLQLAHATYNSSTALVDEIQKQIDADSVLKGRGVTVEWIDTGGNGYLKFTSGTYGSESKIDIDTGLNNPADAVLGLQNGTATDGEDVAGTINGETAEGKGQELTGVEGNEFTAGLKLRINLTSAHVGAGAEGFVTPTKGIAAKTNDLLTSLTRAVDGTFARQISNYEKQVEVLADRISDIDERLAVRRDTLLLQFFQMETALGQLNSQRDFLNRQLAGINNNWGLIQKDN
ncbi:MAG: flagellar filament capping protein FliD [candidate division Zixibacteria bacterium]|nr:flagellar filament capping protein FliD [candidate division Zixibacteria bacterium]MDH3938062.1 flagellar filament capping protein FliD [candidate division Zixibacteria bacterium]MDH4034057.1 flagellar filament capping protein FliD [candidate division Zixibacteria bacterium]